jgi:hypothetical protein
MLLPSDIVMPLRSSDVGQGAKSLTGGRELPELSPMPAMSSFQEAEHEREMVEPNAISIAIKSSSGDSVHHILHSVLAGKVRGSYI